MVWFAVAVSLTIYLLMGYYSNNQMRSNVNSSQTTFTLLPDDELPKTLQNSLQQRDVEYTAAGFQFVNNLRTTRRGTICVSRNYIHRDGLTVACDCVYRGQFGFWPSTSTTGIKSVLDDGTVVEISSHKSIPDFFADMNSETKLRLIAGGTHRINDLVSQHQRSVQEAETQLHSQPFIITDENLNNITEYTLQLCDWQMYRVGILATPPAPVRLMKSRVNLAASSVGDAQ